MRVVRAAFIGSDMNLELELSSALQEMGSYFTIASITLIKDAVAERLASVEGPMQL